MPIPPDFDPDEPASSDGLFGLPSTPEDADIVVIPVPWELTTSYRRGTARGPDRVLEGSHQVDLFLPDAPDLWRRGIAMAPVDPRIESLHSAVLPDALAVIEDADGATSAALARVNEASATLDQLVQESVGALLDAGRTPALLGGDHSVSFGGIAAAVERFPGLGVLHVDAHADLRVAYQGFEGSHASIMHNVLTRTPLKRLVQVGIRDLGRAEWQRMTGDPRIRAFTWAGLAASMAEGVGWSAQANRIVGDLPEHVWISFDIDGLDPVLCPNTGTPVPGGLSWDQASQLVMMVRGCGKRVVGFDLVEVGDGQWDGNVGARLLYRLCAATRRPDDVD